MGPSHMLHPERQANANEGCCWAISDRSRPTFAEMRSSAFSGTTRHLLLQRRIWREWPDHSRAGKNCSIMPETSKSMWPIGSNRQAKSIRPHKVPGTLLQSVEKATSQA